MDSLALSSLLLYPTPDEWTAYTSGAFDYRFVNGVYQLLVGRKWSNITLFNEASVTHIKTLFDEFKLLVPNALCPLMTPMVSRKLPIAFSSIMASISRQYVSSMISHVVEDFEQVYITYLQAQRPCVNHSVQAKLAVCSLVKGCST
ncbi:hypothetical protein [Absidia glauca]|uniref:Uncharacterized protein n=1 Tax=Absidia glauca TaxID=4829 RepID=A0A168ST31_ABSGL|nr:hypothetical protein [Absidia glauca]